MCIASQHPRPRRILMSRCTTIVAAVACVFAATDRPLVAQSMLRLTPDADKALKFRYIGPVGNRVIADAKNADVVFACALGHAYGPQPERGVFRTTDGGRTWNRVLFVDENTGCSDIAMDPNNSRVLFAGMWQLEIHTWGRTSGGSGSGLVRSTDGGTTW